MHKVICLFSQGVDVTSFAIVMSHRKGKQLKSLSGAL
jgi:hypothetical protein